MKQLIIIGRRRGGRAMEVVSGPEVAFHEQRTLFRNLRLQRTHPEFELIELHGLSREGQARFAEPKGEETAAPVVPDSGTPEKAPEAEKAAPAQDRFAVEQPAAHGPRVYELDSEADLTARAKRVRKSK